MPPCLSGASLYWSADGTRPQSGPALGSTLAGALLMRWALKVVIVLVTGLKGVAVNVVAKTIAVLVPLRMLCPQQLRSPTQT